MVSFIFKFIKQTLHTNVVGDFIICLDDGHVKVTSFKQNAVLVSELDSILIDK